MPTLTTDELTQLAASALQKAGASASMAQSTAQALIAAEAEGLSGHGLSRVALYCDHLNNGRAIGNARPKVVKHKGGTCLIDAGGGLAFEACALAANEAIARAKEFGIAFAGVFNSHHMGALAYHLAPIAEAGMAGIAVSTAPSAINAWGGSKPFYGTNPIAAIFPRRDADAVIVDLSLTEVTRGKIMLFAKEGKPIPLGWAVDRDGKPTTDAKAALTGSLMPMGGVKGAALALIVEVLCVACTGAAFSFENDSYFEPGNKPNIGHGIIAIDPGALAGSGAYYARLEVMISTMLADDGVRLPGARRHKLAAVARTQGIAIGDALHKELLALV